jgi:hypothetical protein
MAADDLSAPLGQDQRPKRRRAFRMSFSRIVIAGLGLFALVFAAWTMIADDPFGGEPVAIVPASLVASSPGNTPDQAGTDVSEPGAGSPRNSHESSPADSPAAGPPASKTVTIIDGTSGKRQEIVIPGAANFDSTDQSSAGSTRRGAVAKAAPDTRTPARSTPAR